MAIPRTTVVSRTLLMVATLVIATLLVAEAQSPLPAPAPSLDCTTSLFNVSDCLTYVEAGSNLTKPAPGCCPELAGLVESHPICLCQLLGSAGNFGVQLDVNRALKLPSVCGISTPSVSLCSAIGIPVSAPTASEGPGSAAMSPGGTAMSPGGATTGNNGNGAPSIAVSDLTFLVGLAIAFLLTTCF